MHIKCSTYLNLVVGVLFEVRYEMYTKHLKYSHKCETDKLSRSLARRWNLTCWWPPSGTEPKWFAPARDVCGSWQNTKRADHATQVWRWLRVCTWTSIFEDIFEILTRGHILEANIMDGRLSNVNSSDPFLSVSARFVVCFSPKHEAVDHLS